MNHDELTREEQEALERLPRDRAPSRILEERTVRALRQRGLIQAQSTRTVVRPWMAAAAIAASLAIFASGLAVGQWMGARQTVDALAAVYPDQTLRAAALVQTTGSAYTSALSGLVDATGDADPENQRRAREVALAAFWAAAAEIARLAPDDPLAAQVLRELERARSAQSPASGEGPQSVVWF